MLSTFLPSRIKKIILSSPSNPHPSYLSLRVPSPYHHLILPHHNFHCISYLRDFFFPLYRNGYKSFKIQLIYTHAQTKLHLMSTCVWTLIISHTLYTILEDNRHPQNRYTKTILNKTREREREREGERGRGGK